MQNDPGDECACLNCRTSGKTLTLQQTIQLAGYYHATYFFSTRIEESPRGTGNRHMAWMLQKVRNDDAMTLDKASRWVGFVQAHLAIVVGVPLENLKDHVRKARANVYAVAHEPPPLRIDD